MSNREMGREDVDQKRDPWQALVDTAMKPVDPMTRGKFFTSSLIMNCCKRRSCGAEFVQNHLMSS
jgi:hypothetical protein